MKYFPTVITPIFGVEKKRAFEKAFEKRQLPRTWPAAKLIFSLSLEVSWRLDEATLPRRVSTRPSLQWRRAQRREYKRSSPT